VTSVRAWVSVTGVNKNIISKWVRNEVDQFTGNILVAFCDYFDCDIADLLYYEREK
jgi:putative transcriptional regulator